LQEHVQMVYVSSILENLEKKNQSIRSFRAQNVL
jgi:hypothetical protein